MLCIFCKMLCSWSSSLIITFWQIKPISERFPNWRSFWTWTRVCYEYFSVDHRNQFALLQHKPRVGPWLQLSLLPASKKNGRMSLFLAMTSNPFPQVLDPPIHDLLHLFFFKKNLFPLFFMLNGGKNQQHCIKFSHFTLGGLLVYLK